LFAAELLEQDALLWLFGSGLRDLVDDLEVARDEVRFEPFATLREHGVRIGETSNEFPGSDNVVFW
jgi:hypothetical protein